MFSLGPHLIVLPGLCPVKNVVLLPPDGQALVERVSVNKLHYQKFTDPGM